VVHDWTASIFWTFEEEDLVSYVCSDNAKPTKTKLGVTDLEISSGVMEASSKDNWNGGNCEQQSITCSNNHDSSSGGY
jgi:hypothetical protein